MQLNSGHEAGGLEDLHGAVLVGLGHADDGTSAAHAVLGVDLLLPQSLHSILQVHDLDAGDLGGDDLLGRSHNVLRGSGGLVGSGLALSQELLQAGLLGGGELSGSHLEHLAPHQLGGVVDGAGDHGSAGGTGDNHDQTVIALADAGAVAVAHGLVAAAGAGGGEHLGEDVAGEGVGDHHVGGTHEHVVAAHHAAAISTGRLGKGDGAAFPSGVSGTPV